MVTIRTICLAFINPQFAEYCQSVRFSQNSDYFMKHHQPAGLSNSEALFFLRGRLQPHFIFSLSYFHAFSITLYDESHVLV